MLGFLAGVPGRLKTLTDRLSATWAAKLDTVAGLVTSTWAAKLDTLASNFTSTISGRIDADITSRAAANNPLLLPPKTNGLIASERGGSGVLQDYAGIEVGPTSFTTSFSDIVAYTGSGVLEFCSLTCHTYAATLEIIIDGVTVFSGSTSATLYNALCPVGAYSTTSGVVALSQVPFSSSLQIRAKTATNGSAYSYYKYRKTS